MVPVPTSQFPSDLNKCYPVPDLQALVHPVLSRNADWCHPEAILLAMVADSRRDVRERAVARILACRREAESESDCEIRQFRLPRINIAAEDRESLISWERESVTEPPLTRALSDEQIEALADQPLEVQPYPLHTQAVERAVKIVTEASSVVTEENRHGFICAKMKHRETVRAVRTKRDF